ncbi:hypothetical protein BV22DRAFT_1044868 [Leucogyrophana mollusca]|uniref:Uncharacterized protein n=1 Tax=Leucogyrophana mollusca TaxID=85980 RepID=A0ACB8BQK6_9AGAM|nr:hypothetical protein BV22DRAFT_1044868 [Leucogyrophana mollusca]
MPSGISLQLKSRLLFLFTSTASVLADYYIDDTNTTLTYSSGPKAAWAPYAVGGETLELLLPNGTYQVIDAFACYNQTYRYAACFDTDDCLLTIPFTGSGITYFVFQSGPVGINATITIDGKSPQTTFLAAPPGPAYQISNVSMFNVQGLPSGSHSAQILINDLSGSYSGMMFDYAYVNESTVATTSTTSVGSTSSSSPSTTMSPPPPSSGSHTNIGAVVGGVVAGIAVIVAAVFALMFFRRRKRSGNQMVDLHSEPKVTPYDPYAAYDPPPHSTSPTARTIADTLSTTSILSPNRRNENGDVTQARLPPTPTPFTSSASSSSIPQDRKSRLALANDVDGTSAAFSAGHAAGPAPSVSQSSSEPAQSPQTARQALSPSLTDEQADFINSLYNNNVPAAAIARVMERMLADRGSGLNEWETETRLSRAYSTTAPPAYEFEDL